MSDKSTINQGQCDEYRKELYTEIKRVENMIKKEVALVQSELAEMKGERRFIRYITPIIVTVILAVGGFALTAIIKNVVREAVEKEFRSIKNVSTTMRLSKYP